MEENYKLLSVVLKELQKAGVLKHFILAGSWCQYFYRTVFNASPEIPLLRTTDIDLLIPNPPKIRVHVDVPHILIRLGFDAHFDYKTGLIKYVHPDLEIQFLTPELGRGKDTPYSIKQLGINAEGLRYLTLLQNYCFEIKHEDIILWLPEPEAFVLQKILASQERNDSLKKEKDLGSAQTIGELCLQSRQRRARLKFIFNSLPQTWQKKIIKITKEISPQLYQFLTQRA